MSLLHKRRNHLKTKLTMEVCHPKFAHQLMLIFSILILFSHLFQHCLSSDLTFPPAKLQPYDRNVLIRIQNHFGGPKSHFWNSSDPECCVYCYDQPVRCDEDGHVYGLVLTSGPNLSGPIPSAVADLTFLKDLSLDGPGFTGRIPPAIGKLTNLQFLVILNTSITGPIPASLDRLKNLTRLNLSNNKLSGSVPDSLTQLINVWELDLSSNKLSGPIPDFLSHMTSLTRVVLNSNRFSGPIPVSVCRIIDLDILILSENRLSGSIPDCLGSFKNRIDLWLSRNQLTGSIPKSLGKAGLWTLDVSSNKLTDVSNLFYRSKSDGATDIDVSNNLLSFDFSKLGFSDQLNRLNISRNMIYGSLPKQLGQLPLLVSVDVSFNQLCGSIPRSPVLKKLSPVSFAHNKCLCGAPLPPCK